MLVPTSNRRIHTLDLHAGLALSGYAADARQLVNKARSEAAEYRSFYGSEIPGKVLSDRLALVKQYNRGDERSRTKNWCLKSHPFRLICLFFPFISGHVHTNTLYWHARPFGCSVIIASYDDDQGPQLYSIEPSGVCYVRRKTLTLAYGQRAIAGQR